MEVTDIQYKKSEIGVIPVDWEVKQLSTIGKFTKGQGIRKEEATIGEIPCIRYGELYTSHNDYIKEYFSFISKETAKTARRLKPGDILFAGSGETKEEIGKCAAFIDNIEAYAGGDIVILSPVDVSPVFLGYLLNAQKIQKQKASKGQGDAIVHISANQLGSIQIPLPPTKSEQTAIATALSDTDALIDNLEKLIAKKRNIKQGVMQELLKPKSNWKRKRLGETCEIFGRIGFRGYTIQDIVPEYEGAISLSPSNILDGELNFNKCTFISWKKYEESPEIKLKVGDIVLVKTASIGKTALVKSLPGKTTLNPQIVVLKNISVNNIFLSYLMGYKYIQDQIKEKVVGGVVPTLSQEQIAGFQIFLPSREEQDYIAYFLSLIDNDIETIKRKLNKYKMIKQGMMQALLTGKIRLV